MRCLWIITVGNEYKIWMSHAIYYKEKSEILFCDKKKNWNSSRIEKGRDDFGWFFFFFFFFFGFCTGFHPINGGWLTQFIRRGMRTGQALFPLTIEPGISRVRPWKELLATEAQTTWFIFFAGSRMQRRWMKKKSMN